MFRICKMEGSIPVKQLCNINNKPCLFKTKRNAAKYLGLIGFTEKDIINQNITITEE